MFNGPSPHVGGPILPPCEVTVLTGALPQARVSDMAICAGPTDSIIRGSATVYVGGLQAARMGDNTVHGGVIVTGCFTVLIGDAGGGGGGAGGPGSGGEATGVEIAAQEKAYIGALTEGKYFPRPAAQAQALKDSAKSGAAFCERCAQAAAKKKTSRAARRAAKLARLRKDAEQARKDAIAMLNKSLAALDKWDDDTKEKARTWFGDDSEEVRKTMRKRTSKAIQHLEGMSEKNFELADPKEGDVYAYVYPDKEDKIYLGNGFDSAPATGDNSKAGTLVHETSHFNSVGGTDDVDNTYGHGDCQDLAEKDPKKAQNNADNFEYFVEDVDKSTPSMKLP